MFDGLVGSVVGALVGGLVALLVALLVLKGTRRDNEDLAREQASLAAAKNIGVALHELRRALTRLRELPDRDGSQLVLRQADVLDRQLAEHAPALRDPELRRAVEQTEAVLRNFTRFAFHGPVVEGWSSYDVRITADVQRADYCFLVEEALAAYRRGDPVTVPPRPGWRWHHGYWLWAIPPGVNVDGSGTVEAGWERIDLDDGRTFWRDPAAEPSPAPRGRPLRAAE